MLFLTILYGSEALFCQDVINFSRGLNLHLVAPSRFNTMSLNCRNDPGVYYMSDADNQLWLDNLYMNGTINATALNRIKSVVIWVNDITGPIPTLPAFLKTFVASYNCLNGTLPPFSSGIIEFHVDTNSITGSIPTIPANLYSLNVRNNIMGGIVPLIPLNFYSLLLSGNK